MVRFSDRSHLIPVVLFTTAFSVGASRVQAGQSPDVLKSVAGTGVTGGLCVQVGAEKTDLAAELAETGRFLVQVLDNDNQVIDQARRLLRSKGLYGLVSVERMPKQGGLPFTENLAEPAGSGGWTAYPRPTSTIPLDWISTTSTCYAARAMAWPCRVGCSIARRARCWWIVGQPSPS